MIEIITITLYTYRASLSINPRLAGGALQFADIAVSGLYYIMLNVGISIGGWAHIDNIGRGEHFYFCVKYFGDWPLCYIGVEDMVADLSHHLRMCPRR